MDCLAWRQRRPVQRAAGPVRPRVQRSGGPPDLAPEGPRVPPQPEATGRRGWRELAGPSGVQPKTEPAHRVERKPGELGPDLPDEEVQRPGPANHRGAPDLEHELFAADRLT